MRCQIIMDSPDQVLRNHSRGYVLRDPIDELGRGEEDHKQVANL